MEEKNINTAAFLTILTAAAYACAYAYESGYLAHFGLPAEFVEVDLRGVMLCLFALGGTGALMFFQGIFTLIPAKLDPDVARLVYSTLLIVAIVGGTLMILEPPKATVIFTLGFVGLIIAGEVLLPYLIHRRKGMTYLESLKADRVESQQTALNAMLHKAGRKWVGIVGLAVLAALVSYLLGALMAKRQDDFLFADDCVALRIHDDLIVCALWEGGLTGKYEFRPAAGATLSIERLGPMPAYTHRNLLPISSKQARTDDPAALAPGEEQPEVEPNDQSAVADGNSNADTRNLPEPQPQQ